jgi:hypothetical protein
MIRNMPVKLPIEADTISGVARFFGPRASNEMADFKKSQLFREFPVILLNILE